MAGWLALHQRDFVVEAGAVKWLRNPIRVLADTYHYLNMDYQAGQPAADMIWDHDNRILSSAIDFYTELEQRLETQDYSVIDAKLSAEGGVDGLELQESTAARAAHAGYQAGLEMLSVLPWIAAQTEFPGLSVNDDLSIAIPEALQDSSLQTTMAKVLVPPPVAKSDEILALSGGMYYPREAPESPPFIEVGAHFEQGDPLYIVEVMKMFNKVYAPFSGTIEKILVEGEGVIIKKGQPLFKIVPDEKIVVESPEEIEKRRTQQTDIFLHSIAANAG